MSDSPELSVSNLPPRLAQISLNPNRVDIVGPLELVQEYNDAIEHARSTQGDISAAVNRVLGNWYTKCSATGKYFPVTQLRYWRVNLSAPESVDVYCCPEVMSEYQGLPYYSGPAN